MKLASHNSWSYLKPKKWWMKLINFSAKCQEINIKDQYNKHHVKCFDLHLNTAGGDVKVVHGAVTYDITLSELKKQLKWLDYRQDVAVRMVLDIRSKKALTEEAKFRFRQICNKFEKTYPRIKFWYGRNLADWEHITYQFDYKPTCEEKYSSVCKPKLLDDWYPKMFAKKNNRRLYAEGTECDYLMLDFVNLPKHVGSY